MNGLILFKGPSVQGGLPTKEGGGLSHEGFAIAYGYEIYSKFNAKNSPSVFAFGKSTSPCTEEAWVWL